MLVVLRLHEHLTWGDVLLCPRIHTEVNVCAFCFSYLATVLCAEVGEPVPLFKADSKADLEGATKREDTGKSFDQNSSERNISAVI